MKGCVSIFEVFKLLTYIFHILILAEKKLRHHYFVIQRATSELIQDLKIKICAIVSPDLNRPNSEAASWNRARKNLISCHLLLEAVK